MRNTLKLSLLMFTLLLTFAAGANAHATHVNASISKMCCGDPAPMCPPVCDPPVDNCTVCAVPGKTEVKTADVAPPLCYIFNGSTIEQVPCAVPDVESVKKQLHEKELADWHGSSMPPDPWDGAATALTRFLQRIFGRKQAS